MVKYSNQFFPHDEQAADLFFYEQSNPQIKNKIPNENKEKAIKKQKPNKKSDQRGEQQNKNIPEHKDCKGKAETKQIEEAIEKQKYNEESQSFVLSDIQDNFIPQKQREEHQNSLSASPNRQYQQSGESGSGNEDQIQDLRMMLIQFFNSIDQPNGLVFKSELRKKLQNLYPHIGFTLQHDLDPEGEQVHKILTEVMKLIIFDKKNHNNNLSDQNFSKYIKKDVKQIMQVFKEVSYIFCKEVTSELYNILRKLCNIVLEFRNRENKQMPQNSQIMIKKLREFGDKIAGQNDLEHQYFFFGYQFYKFPQGKSDAEQNVLAKSEKYKYALKSRYRKPNTEFAKFAEKAGIYLLRNLTNLKSYKTLI